MLPRSPGPSVMGLAAPSTERLPAASWGLISQAQVPADELRGSRGPASTHVSPGRREAVVKTLFEITA